MNLPMPYVRYAVKTAYFLKDRRLIARDCHLLYILSGEGSFESEGLRILLKPNTLVYYPYGKPYYITAQGKMLFYTVNFDFDASYDTVRTMVPQEYSPSEPIEYLQSIPKESEAVFSKIKADNNALWAERHLRRICERFIEPTVYGRQIQSAELLLLLYELLERENQTEHPLCLQIKNLIADDLHLNNIQLAERLNYHPYYLNSLFKKYEGMTLHGYINKTRLAQAYQQITTTRKSLEQIALMCGFHSSAHLSTAFKQYYQFSPGQLRRKI